MRNGVPHFTCQTRNTGSKTSGGSRVTRGVFITFPSRSVRNIAAEMQVTTQRTLGIIRVHIEYFQRSASVS